MLTLARHMNTYGTTLLAPPEATGDICRCGAPTYMIVVGSEDGVWTLVRCLNGHVEED